MNRTSTLSNFVVSSPLERTQFFIAWMHVPTQMDRGGISGDLTDFSSTYTALRAVKGTEKGNESRDDLTRQCGKSPVTTNTVLHRVQLTWMHPRRWIEVVFQVT